MLKLRLYVTTILLSAMLLVGAAFAQTGTLELAIDTAPVGLDPHLTTAFSSFVITGQIYDALVEVDAALEVQPGLATSWTISDDGLVYVFQLREGVRFHNGRTMTADDVVYSFERIANPETASPQASRFAQVGTAVATGEYEVTFTLTQQYAPFITNLPNLSVVPQEVVEANGNLQQVAVGTGPFMLTEVVPDTYVLLSANPDYYREGQPGVAALKFNIVPVASTRAAGLRTGTYHMIPDVDPATAETLRNVSGITLMGVQDLAYTLLGFNTTREPFNDPRVRQAINYAIDREELVEGVYFGNAVPGGPLSPGLQAWAEDTSAFACYATNLDTARSLLADAGFPDGFSTEILTFGTIQVVTDSAQVLQAQLAQVGIDATVNVAEFGTFVQDWTNSNFDMFVSLNGGNPDPDGYLHRTFVTGGSTNVFKYSDAEVDRLLEAGRTTADMAARVAIYNDLQERLACEGPIAHLAYGTLFSAVSDDVHGFQQLPTRSLRYLREVTLD
ncbi:MAG TPA: ABC transporter substrate-binding protein [Trueperaceae bacterium]|nr:ABC transporter substrate-binding protein [Trueperaceae bacterium]